MEVNLKRELEAFVHEQVRLGHWRSVDEVIEAGIARLMLDPVEGPFDAETRAAIEESIAQMERGEGIPIEELHAEFSKRYGIPPRRKDRNV